MTGGLARSLGYAAVVILALAHMAVAQDGMTREEILERWRAQAGRPEAGADTGEARTRGLAITPSAAAPTAPPTLDREMTVDLQITFETASAAIRAGEQRDLRALCAAMRDAPGTWRFNVIGHADAAGPDGLNQRLSEARGRSVARWLATDCAIDRDRLAVFGLGESRLLPGVPPVSEANRRVEVSIRRP